MTTIPPVQPDDIPATTPIQIHNPPNNQPTTHNNTVHHQDTYFSPPRLTSFIHPLLCLPLRPPIHVRSLFLLLRPKPPPQARDTPKVSPHPPPPSLASCPPSPVISPVTVTSVKQNPIHSFIRKRATWILCKLQGKVSLSTRNKTRV